jgi:hypothetical protein
MSDKSIPYGTGEIVAALVIRAGKDNADKLARAKTLANVASFFAAAGKADFTSINAQVTTAISGISDPGLQQVATTAWNVASPYVQVDITLEENVPVLGGSLEQALTDIGAGMATVAGGWIGKLQSATPEAK